MASGRCGNDVGFKDGGPYARMFAIRGAEMFCRIRLFVRA